MITLNFDLVQESPKHDGIVASHPVLGKVATVVSTEKGWEVFPYCFPAYEKFGVFRGSNSFASVESAKLFCHVIAHEMLALRKGSWAEAAK
jgi:hypothetical protein